MTEAVKSAAPTGPRKNVPEPTSDTAAYWEAANRGELLIQRCRACGQPQFFPRSICIHCWSGDLEWQRASGKGRVYCFSVIHRAPSKAYAGDVPYVLALVELDEGVRMMTNVVGCPPDEVTVEMPVEVVFERLTDEIALPKFRPAGR
ncbi:MAG: Zn-ribbon domain-containing OB-fold protein [Chloroflexi bacterium]|nr:Zn-ribbon domain-containing OB-fold protein [Chloroflexota bacterium]